MYFDRKFWFHITFYLMAMVDSLITEIHRRDMKVVFHLVLNHTSDQQPWFLESKSWRDDPKSDWYVWKDVISSRSLEMAMMFFLYF